MTSPETDSGGGGLKISIVVIGTDDAGQPFREQVSATIAEGGKYSLPLARPLRVWDAVRIEFPVMRPGEKPRGIAARVTSVQEGADPAGCKTIHLQPEGLIKGPLQPAGNAPPPETVDIPAPRAAPEKVPAPAAPSADRKAPLLEAVRAEAADAISRDLLRPLIVEAQTVSVELGRKLTQQLTGHATDLTAALSKEALDQMKQMQARVDELQRLWTTMRATLDQERATLDQMHHGKLQAFREAADAQTAEAGKKLQGFRHAQAEEQRAIAAHLQQTAWTSVSSATRDMESKVEGLVAAAVARARAQIDALEGARERSWREHTARLQGNLENFLARWEAGMQQAEATLQSLQVVTQQAEAAAAAPPAAARAPEAPPGEVGETVSVAERIQQSLAAARATFRESLSEISRVLEHSLQANKYPPVAGENGPSQ